ncbi:hypothetical protein ACET3Z_018049 [Daucus carota]
METVWSKNEIDKYLEEESLNICWLKEQGQYGGTKLNECVDDIHSFDFLSGDENEKMDSRTSKEKLKGKIIDVIDA